MYWITNYFGKPFFSNGDRLLQAVSEVAEELNKFFKEAVSTLDVNKNHYMINLDSLNISDPIEGAISNYEFHPSTFLINDKIVKQDKFSFKPISILDFEKEVQLFCAKNATASDSILPKILKISSADALQTRPFQ